MDKMRDHIEHVAVKKASFSISKTFILAILGGIYIAFGALFAIIAGSGSQGMSYGVVRLLMGITFSLGLILVIIGGAELFTGSTIVTTAVINKKIGLVKLLRNWLIVYAGNFCGGVLIALLVFLSSEYTFGNGAIGTTALTIALSKVHHTFLESIALGIMCNILVCLAIWLTFSTKSITGKIAAIIFPVAAFVAAGFEHSVANMFFLPFALFIKGWNPQFVSTTSLNLIDLTWRHFLVTNLLPVTIGNIIGGSAIWLVYNKVYKKT